MDFLQRGLMMACAGVLSAGLLMVDGRAAEATAQVAANAQPAAETSAPAPLVIETPLTVELNKLETIDTGCRAYVVVNNTNDMAFKSLLLELYMFRTDGVIGRRFALDLGPLRATKRTVKLFDLNAVKCDEIGSFLIDDVVKCESGDAKVTDCLSGLDVTSLTKVSLTK
ncbi:MAG: hypothetical protein AAFV45_02320 [Pseudomonadota bacterium]